RLFAGATRRAVELRDRECTHPYCDRPAPGCEVDHIVPFGAGGPTTQAKAGCSAGSTTGCATSGRRPTGRCRSDGQGVPAGRMSGGFTSS
ncbi:MAG TPA: HNH endonuclease signature motif containing protein, partial [Acidimicrobiales bacterium]|nr:HNH endonuclease signature motif containing protein [Acidimicrobiales bacterium]